MSFSRIQMRNTFNYVRQYWKIVAFISVPLLCLILPLVTWPTESGKGAYILLVTSIFLVFEILPLPLTILFSIFLMPMIGVQTVPEISRSFTNDTYFLFISVLVMAISIETTNTHTRIALLTLRRIGVSPSRLILGFAVISGGLSMWMANTAVTVMILPIAMAVSGTLTSPVTKEDTQSLDAETIPTPASNSEVSQNGDASMDPLMNKRESTLVEVAESVSGKPPDQDFSKALQLCVAFCANIGGVATLIGSHPNILFRMTLEKYYGTETGLNFLTYFLICGPVAVGALILTWIALCLLFVPGWLKSANYQASPEQHKAMRKRTRAILDHKLKELGPIRHEEVSVLILFAVLLVLWLTRNPQFVPGWAALFKQGYATDSVPALLACVLLFVLPADYKDLKKGKYRPLLTWKQAQAKLPWDLLMFAGGVAAVTHVAEVSGLIRSIGSLIPDLHGISPWIVVTVICVLASFLTEFTNNSVICAIFVPVLANVAEDSGVNPIYYMLAATMASMFSFMIPICSFPTIIVYGYGTVTMWDMFRAGVGPKIACIIFLVISLELFGSLIFDGKNLPLWAQTRLAARHNISSVLAMTNNTVS